MKKILFIIVLLLVILVAVYLSLFRANPSKEVIIQKETFLAADSKGDILERSPKNVVYSFGISARLPTTRPAFSYKTISKEQLFKIGDDLADLLGFTSTASSLLRGAVFTKSWNQSPDKFLQLSFSSTSSNITYSRAKISAGTPSVKNISTDMLMSPITTSLGVQINLENGPASDFDGLLILDRPIPYPLTSKLLRYVKNQALIATGDMNLSGGTIISDKNGVIRSATITLPLQTTGPAGSVMTLSQDQILESLRDGRGRIITLGAVSRNVLGSNAPFSRFIITGIIEFYAPNNGFLLPALILTGDATTTSGLAPIKIFLWNYAASR